jgi:hypothetical protein
VGDPWLSIMLTLCHILHSVSHWPVLVYFIKITISNPKNRIFCAAECRLWDMNPEGDGRTPGPAQDRGACRSSWGRPHRPRHVQVGLTIVFVLAAGNEATS